MTDPEQPRQLTVAELLARNPGVLDGRQGPRRRRAAPEDDEPEAAPTDQDVTPVGPDVVVAEQAAAAEPGVVAEEGGAESAATGTAQGEVPPPRAVEPSQDSSAVPASTTGAGPTPEQISAAFAQIEIPARPEDGPEVAEATVEPAAAVRLEPQPDTGPEPDPVAQPEPEAEPNSDASPGPEAVVTPERPTRRSRTRAEAADKRPWRKRHPALQALILVVAVLALVAGYYVSVLLVAQGQIERQDVLRPDAPEILEPAAQVGSENYLIVVADSDDKAGEGAQITALAHLAADGSRLVIISFPRTTIVDVPSCGTSADPVEPFTATLAATYAEGGARCSVAAVQALTGININHYLGVDLAEFPKVVDALGGVPVCLTAPLVDPQHDVSLEAGTTELDGTAATNYVRAVASGNGEDPARASRQIGFISSVFGEVLSVGTFANPIRVTRFAFAAADAFTLDTDTTLGQLRTFGARMESLAADGDNATIVVPPVESGGSADKPEEPTILDPDGSRALFDAVIIGADLPDPSSDGGEQPATVSPAPTTAAPASSSPPVAGC